MNFRTIFTAFGVALMLFGCGLLLVAYRVRSANVNIQSSPAAVVQQVEIPALQPTIKQGRPITLKVDDVQIKNDVIDGYFNAKSGQWTLTKDKVQFATITRQPNNEQGLTFLYGHNRKEVFSRLKNVKPGSIATVTTDNGLRFTYKFISSTVVKPTDVSIFDYNGAPILVIQTCTGLFYENRQLFTFEFVGVENA